jgi:hypothetical protein
LSLYECFVYLFGARHTNLASCWDREICGAQKAEAPTHVMP